MLYKIIEPLKEGDEVVYVGTYVTRWGKDVEPTIGFVPATKEDIEQVLKEMEG